MNKIKSCAIIVAGGKGTRMGTNILKQYLEICGIPVLARTLLSFENCKDIDEIVLVTGKEEIDYCKKEFIEKYNITKVKKVVAGGKERQNSVYNGLKALAKDTDIVLIHDGVRPFVKSVHIKKLIEETLKYDSCVLGVKVKDTIKICNDSKIVKSTPERKDVWIAQTPQSFKYSLILQAHEEAIKDNFLGTDDSMLVERLGNKVKMTEGDYDNIKITTPDDIYFCDAIITNQKKI